MKIRKEIEKWILKLKNPKLELLVIRENSDKNDPHWISSCSGRTLGRGLSKNFGGKIEGKGEMFFDKKSKCFQEFEVERVVGTFIGGLLDGMASIHFKNQSFFIAPFYRGSVSGLARDKHL